MPNQKFILRTSARQKIFDDFDAAAKAYALKGSTDLPEAVLEIEDEYHRARQQLLMLLDLDWTTDD